MNDMRFTTLGYTLIELVLIVALIAIIATYTVSQFSNNTESIRFELTRSKMEAIRDAILGKDASNSEGRRVNFGYHGDMGRMPQALTELGTVGTQAAWVYSTADGFGSGWRGPYLNNSMTGASSILNDEWGNAFVYNTGSSPASLISRGADRAAGGSGYMQDLTVEFPTGLRFADVRGVVVDKDSRMGSKTVTIRYPVNGAVSSTNATSSAQGIYTFTGIPLGARSLAITSVPTLGPKTVVIDKAPMDISSSILNFNGASEALTAVSNSAILVGGTANTTGFNNQVLMAQVQSTYRSDLQISFITVTVGGSAKVVSYSLNGVKHTFSSPVATGSRQAINTRQVFPALSSASNFEMSFDTSIKGQAITILFEYYNSARTDSVSFTGDPTWGLPGNLDLSFKTTGIVTTTLGTGNDVGYAIAIQTDAKVITAGFSSNGANNDIALVRYNIDGVLDTSFNLIGRLTRSIGTAADVLYSLLLQTDGRIVAAGSSTTTTTDSIIVRYLTQGTLDTSFNNTGILRTTLVAGANDELYGLALQTDGRIIATGTGNSTDYRIALVRFLTNGTLDTSFATTGFRLTSFGASNDAYGRSVQIQTDGKIVVGGYAESSDYDFVVMRHNTNGTLDTTFKTTGICSTTMVGSDDAFGRALVIQTDGKLLLSGIAGAPNEDFATVRYNTDGALDTSFNTTGKKYTAVNSDDDRGFGMALQGNGRIVIGGTSDVDGSSGFDFALVRYQTDGALDTTFNTIGKLLKSLNTIDILYGIAIDTNGRIIGVGQNSTGSQTDFGLIRVWP